MLGGVSHVDTFDPKPALNKYAGKNISETPHKDALKSPFVKENVKSSSKAITASSSRSIPCRWVSGNTARAASR